MGKADCSEANLTVAMRARPQLLLLAIRSLAASAHGRFFLHPSAVAKNTSKATNAEENAPRCLDHGAFNARLS